MLVILLWLWTLCLLFSFPNHCQFFNLSFSSGRSPHPSFLFRQKSHQALFLPLIILFVCFLRWFLVIASTQLSPLQCKYSSFRYTHLVPPGANMLKSRWPSWILAMILSAWLCILSWHTSFLQFWIQIRAIQVMTIRWTLIYNLILYFIMQFFVLS